MQKLKVKMQKFESKFSRKGGFTITELAITSVTSTIVIFAIGVILADAHRGWNKMYNRVYADVVTDSYVARKAFDRVVRQAAMGVTTGEWLEVYYFADANSVTLDRYAHFYIADGQLIVEQGVISPRQSISSETICGNVSDCDFTVSGRSAQMILSLDDGSQAITVVASGYMHN